MKLARLLPWGFAFALALASIQTHAYTASFMYDTPDAQASQLRQAIASENLGTVRQATTAGAYVGIRELTLAVTIGNPAIVDALLEKTTLKLEEYGCFLLFNAAASSFPNSNDYQTNLNGVDFNGKPRPGDRAQIVKMLLERKANPNCTDRGNTLLLGVIYVPGMSGAVKALLDAGADPNAKPKDRVDTVLAVVVEQLSAAWVRQCSARSPVHDPAERQRVIDHLLEARADPNGHTKHPYSRLWRVLYEKGYYDSGRCTRQPSLDLMRKFVKHGLKATLGDAKLVKEVVDRESGEVKAYYSEILKIMNEAFEE